MASVETAEQALGRLCGGVLLDVATGQGGFISFLLENIADYKEIIGIDTSVSSLVAARQAFPQANIQFLLMDAAYMNFTDGKFDTVCMANSMHHIKDLHAALSEVLRVCKPGGKIILCEAFQDRQSQTQLTNVYFHHWKAAVDTAEGIYHRETYTRREVIEFIEGMNLHDLEYYEVEDQESDPMEARLLKKLEEIIDNYIERIEGLEQGSQLRKRGEEIKQRVREVGFRGATSLLAIGNK
jgi:ubiquinone/menaquinone biosynthesis C-methylase UbiE